MVRFVEEFSEDTQEAEPGFYLNAIKLRGQVARRGVRVADKMRLIIAGIAVRISLCKLHHW